MGCTSESKAMGGFLTFLTQLCILIFYCFFANMMDGLQDMRP